jgi:hypothetical protein
MIQTGAIAVAILLILTSLSDAEVMAIVSGAVLLGLILYTWIRWPSRSVRKRRTLGAAAGATAVVMVVGLVLWL